MDMIAVLEKEEIERLGKKIPAFAPETPHVGAVVEGEKRRAAYEGVVIAKATRPNSSFRCKISAARAHVPDLFALIAGAGERKGDGAARSSITPDRSGVSIREKLAHVHKEKQE
jgi:large subunit ribosomal protein L19